MKQKSIFWDIFLTLITFGIWNLWVQVRQINAVNDLAGKKRITSPIWVFVFSILTFGLYFAYHEYLMTHELHLILYNEADPLTEILLSVLTFFGLWFIIDSYQQSLINQIIEQRGVL